jgi:two-component system, chemotaxis family, chemotaxis protein CheY
MKVLLVDDSSTMRRILKGQLAALGVTDVVEAANGKLALDTLASEPGITNVLLDWNMPEMDGFTCLKRIREYDMYKGIKIIMCTSEADKSKVVEALRAGANNYIIKPFTPETIKEKLGI